MREAQALQMSGDTKTVKAKAGLAKVHEPLSPKLANLLMMQAQHRQGMGCGNPHRPMAGVL